MTPLSDAAASGPIVNGESPRAFRISIAHWLWWLSITAVLLAIHRGDLNSVTDSFVRDPQSRTRFNLIWRMNGAANLVVTPFHALAIVGFGLALWRRLSGRKGFPIQPGHWLLVCLGVYILTHELARVVFRNLISPWWDNPDLPQEAVDRLILLGDLMDAVPFVVALFLLPIPLLILRDVRWRIVFLAASVAATTFIFVAARNAAGYKFLELTEWLEFTAKCLIMTSGAAAVLAATIDVVRYLSRDIVHWLGVATAVASTAHAAVWDFSFWWAVLVIPVTLPQ